MVQDNQLALGLVGLSSAIPPSLYEAGKAQHFVTFNIIWHSSINIIWHSAPPRCSVISLAQEGAP